MRMKNRYRLVRRNDRGGIFYLVDNATKLRESRDTSDRGAAEQILHARRQTQKQTSINLQIARAYLAATDEKVTRRVWKDVMEEMAKHKKGSTLERWERAVSLFKEIRPNQDKADQFPGMFAGETGKMCELNAFDSL
jgi:hypothetical protein